MSKTAEAGTVNSAEVIKFKQITVIWRKPYDCFLNLET